MRTLRKFLEVAGAAGVLALWAITAVAIFGPQALPARIPSHFDAAGRPNDWNSPAFLWCPPIIATFMYAVMTLVANLALNCENSSVSANPEIRRRQERLARLMLSWIKVEVVCLVLVIQHAVIRSARTGRGRFSPLILICFFIAALGTVGWHVAATLKLRSLNSTRTSA